MVSGDLGLFFRSKVVPIFPVRRNGSGPGAEKEPEVSSCRSRIFAIGAVTAASAVGLAVGLDHFVLPVVGLPERVHALCLGGLMSALIAGTSLLLAQDLERTLVQFEQRPGGAGAAPNPLSRPASWIVQPLLERSLLQLRELHDKRQDAEDRVRELEVQFRIAEGDREELEGILHALRDGVLVIDGFGDLVTANEAAAEIFHFDLANAVEHNIDELIGDAEIVRLIHEARESGNPSYRRLVEHTLQSARRSVIYEISLCSMSDADGEVAGVVILLHDITTEREISDMKSDFVSKASHELKTPLSGIKAYIEMLIDGEAQDESSRREFYSIIQNEADRLGRLIESMLNISRIEAGIMQVEWEDLDLCDVVDEVIEFMLPQAQSRNLTLTAKRPIQAVRAEVDRNLVQQVVTNLVSNAIKYTPEGGRITVTSALADCDQSAMIAVTDTGLGISPDDIPKLFDKFYRIENYKRVAKGTGLGLNLVKQIVETVHGGEIGVESQLGMGSKFWFSLPCRRQSRAAA